MLPTPQLCCWKVPVALLTPMRPALRHFQAVFPWLHIAALGMLRKMCLEDEVLVKTERCLNPAHPWGPILSRVISPLGKTDIIFNINHSF